MSGATDLTADRRAGWPVRRLLAIYLALATPPLLLSGRPATWPLWLALHLGAALLAWPPARLARAGARLHARWPRTTRILLDWYPILLVPALYTELGFLIPAVHGGQYFDHLILAVEQAVFGGQPSRDLAGALPFYWLSELLHASYLSYYFIIIVPPALLYATGRREAAARVIFGVMLAFVLHYLVFVYFPVQGPRYLFAPPTGPMMDGPIVRLAHWVLEEGSSQGAAFPSSHVGVSFAQFLLTWRYQRRLAPAVGVLTLLLAVGAVYGGFHYAIDAACGAVLGTIAVLVAPAAYRALQGRSVVSGPAR